MKTIQFCPKCYSTKIITIKLLPGEELFTTEGTNGWICVDCNYSGKDFFIVSEAEYIKIKKKKNK